MARLCFGCMLVFALIISPGCERRGDSSANSTPSDRVKANETPRVKVY